MNGVISVFNNAHFAADRDGQGRNRVRMPDLSPDRENSGARALEPGSG